MIVRAKNNRSHGSAMSCTSMPSGVLALFNIFPAPVMMSPSSKVTSTPSVADMGTVADIIGIVLVLVLDMIAKNREK